MRLISVVMGTPSINAREAANAALLSHGFTFYETTRIKGARETVLKPRVYKSEAETAPVGTAQALYVTVGRGDATSLRTATKLNEPLIAPLKAGQPVGELTVTAATGEIIARVPLVSLQAVPQAGWWTRMTDSIALWFE
jgi:D-alanyl-D-alanine carboxypeptidase (penicillin-binding protein 5/6)